MELGFDELHDYRSVTRIEASGQEITDFANSFRRYDDGGRTEGSNIAFVADMDEVFGLSRMTQMLREDSPPEFQVFRDMAAARKWLGLPVEGEDAKDSEWVAT